MAALRGGPGRGHAPNSQGRLKPKKPVVEAAADCSRERACAFSIAVRGRDRKYRQRTINDRLHKHAALGSRIPWRASRPFRAPAPIRRNP